MSKLRLREEKQLDQAHMDGREQGEIQSQLPQRAYLLYSKTLTLLYCLQSQGFGV